VAQIDQSVELRANDLMRMSITVKIVGLKWWWLRARIGIAVLRLAAILLPGPVNVSIDAGKDRRGNSD
jgi:hypothetical protein